VLSVAEGAKNIRVPIGQVRFGLPILYQPIHYIYPSVRGVDSLCRALRARWRPRARPSTSWMPTPTRASAAGQCLSSNIHPHLVLLCLIHCDLFCLSLIN
jgi:hypothetical protein